MNTLLKKLLYFDLRRLLPGRRALPEASVEPRQFWFYRVFSFLARRRRDSAHFASMDWAGKNYQPGRYYRWISPKRQWPGPFYLSNKHWRTDLLKVTNTLAAIVKTNASLPKGLESAAREENRLRRQLSAVQLWGMVQASSWGIGFLAVGLYITFNAFDFLTWPAVSIFLLFCAMGTFTALYALYRYRPEEALFLTLRDHLSAGRPLSDAMRRMPRFFPAFYADLVNAGEDSGRLGECLEQLSDDTLQNLYLGRTLRIFALYLGGVFIIQSAIVTFIMVKIYPVFRDIGDEFGVAPAAPLRLADGLHELVCMNPQISWPAIYVFGAFFLILIAASLRTRARRRALFTRSAMSLFAYVPGLRALVVEHNLASAAFVLEKLLRAGVTLDRAVAGAAAISLNPAYRNLFTRLHRRLEQGEPLAEALDAESPARLVPRAFRAFVHIGERSGMLPDALARIGDLYRRAADKQVRMMADMVLPFGVIALGFLTLFAELTLFLTLVNIYDSVNTF